MLFFSFFKTLTQQTVTVELKNDISIRGTLKSVDQYLNIKLDDITVLDELKYPHLSSVKNIFIRGSVRGDSKTSGKYCQHGHSMGPNGLVKTHSTDGIVAAYSQQRWISGSCGDDPEMGARVALDWRAVIPTPFLAERREHPQGRCQ
ncbi:LSM domain-containing protein [Cladophialophora immunda]|nr:LSM domain-containing protein [Cladophialophora immunda]